MSFIDVDGVEQVPHASRAHADRATQVHAARSPALDALAGDDLLELRVGDEVVRQA
ncbi:MAG: hypothetical protein U1F35_10595 [Steroidobacteraceae bacterium]